jgi:cysteine desulfurase/selenocysteine lyase
MGVYVDTALAHEFPALAREGLAYLDSAATSQTPRSVLDAMADYYERHRASVHRGTYPLAVEATDLYEHGRVRAAQIVGGDPQSTILVRNTTEAINLVAYSWGRTNLEPGDEVVVTEMEHHSNIVPWQLACEATGAELHYVPVDDDGELVLSELDVLLRSGHVRMVAVAHVSNVLGTINPIADIAARAHAVGALVLVDGSQAVPQMAVDLAELDCDFYAWTGHKAYGPTGIGVLHGRRELLDAMPPFLGGGEMIRDVRLDGFTTNDVPWKFEAGTQPIAEAIGFGAAVDYMTALGMPAVRDHEMRLTRYTLDALRDRFPDSLTIYGPLGTSVRGGAVSFLFDGIHAHDISQVLDEDAVCVRAGHHCAKPLMRQLGVPATTRASVYIYNDEGDIDVLVESLAKAQKFFTP